MTPAELVKLHRKDVAECYRYFLPHWVDWCEAEGLTCEDGLTHAAAMRFARYYGRTREMTRHSMTVARGAVRALGRLVGQSYGVHRGAAVGVRDCLCGERACRIGGLACEVCMESQRQMLARGTRNRLVSKRTQMLRAAMREHSASEVGLALCLDVRGVWLRYCGRVEVSENDAERCRRLVEKGGRTTWAPKTLEDFIYAGDGA